MRPLQKYKNCYHNNKGIIREKTVKCAIGGAFRTKQMRKAKYKKTEQGKSMGAET